MCGDMLDAFSYKLVEGIEQRTYTDELNPEREEQYKDFIEVFSKMSIPLICVCGNHDVWDAPTAKSVKKYEEEFGSNYFSFYVNGCLFISLNSNYYYDSEFCEQLVDEQNRWLDAILKREAKRFKHVVIFLHVPLFVRSIDERTSILNIPIEKRKFLVDKFRKAGIKKVFCGHIHENSVAKFEDLECVSTSAIGLQIGQDESGFRVVKVEKKQIKHKYYAFSDCPNKLDL